MENKLILLSWLLIIPVISMYAQGFVLPTKKSKQRLRKFILWHHNITVNLPIREIMATAQRLIVSVLKEKPETQAIQI